MLGTIFQKEDFRLCNLPVPKGYPYSQTHVGVAYSVKGIGGYHWFLTSSPYPNPKRSAFIRGLRFFAKKIIGLTFKPSDWYENPMLYFGKEGSELITEFVPFSGNPLMKTPDDLYGSGAFNSDPDIYIEDDIIYVLNRPTWRFIDDNGNKKYISKQYLMKITYDANRFIASEPIHLFDYPKANGSPSLIFYNGKYRIISLISSAYNTGKPCKYAEMVSSERIDGNYGIACKVKIDTQNYHPWHFSLFTYKSDLYSVVACIKGKEKQRCYQMLGKFSKDLSVLHIYQKPLTDMHSYRGDAVVLPNGDFVLYTTIIEAFPNSLSVDGRDVLVIKRKFEQVIFDLEKFDEKNIDLQ